MSKYISDLVGSTITHIKYGECQVIEVTDKDSFKFNAKVISSGEIKKFVFSTQFFSVEGDFASAKIKPAPKLNKDKKYKPVDYNKYRNHPWVKEIERRESGRRIQFVQPNNNEDMDETEED